MGPPGCGKTSIVRKLCFSTKACLISTSGAHFAGISNSTSAKELYKVNLQNQLSISISMTLNFYLYFLENKRNSKFKKNSFLHFIH